jgi:hypothetical protein
MDKRMCLVIDVIRVVFFIRVRQPAANALSTAIKMIVVIFTRITASL